MQTIGSIEVLSRTACCVPGWHGQHHIYFTKVPGLFWETCPAVLQRTRLPDTARPGTANGARLTVGARDTLSVAY
jgi:hypothetical protein